MGERKRRRDEETERRSGGAGGGARWAASGKRPGVDRSGVVLGGLGCGATLIFAARRSGVRVGAGRGQWAVGEGQRGFQISDSGWWGGWWFWGVAIVADPQSRIDHGTRPPPPSVTGEDRKSRRCCAWGVPCWRCGLVLGLVGPLLFVAERRRRDGRATRGAAAALFPKNFPYGRVPFASL